MIKKLLIVSAAIVGLFLVAQAITFFYVAIFDEGGTEFFYQRIRTQPRKGLTLIWPADWTHLHRGVVSPSEEKYIITGWFDFL